MESKLCNIITKLYKNLLYNFNAHLKNITSIKESLKAGKLPKCQLNSIT